MDITTIFKAYIVQYLNRYGKKIPFQHVKTIYDMIRCRTPALGGDIFYCKKCKKNHFAFHSCKNRHCPKCGSQDAEEWLEKQKRKLLPVPYFMVTFTLPDELRELCRANQKIFYSIMFKAAATALKTLLKDPKYAGGSAGFTGVLHTWTRQLLYHVHIHFIVPGGAYDFERKEWEQASHKFLVPVKALSKSFRSNFQKLLQKKASKLYKQIPASIWKEKEFITNSIPVGKGESAFTYLANYVYKTAITNNRVIACENGNVTFQYTDSNTNKTKTRTIPVLEFMRRFLLHVLPSGFQKVRYYGFLSSATKNKWEQIVDHFQIKKTVSKTEEKKPKQINCPRCKCKMVFVESISRSPRPPPKKMKEEIRRSFRKQINV